MEFDQDNGFEAADPTFREARSGQAFTARQGIFAEVPEELRHQVTVRLKRELTTLLSALFGAPSQDVAVVLEQTFPAVELWESRLPSGMLSRARRQDLSLPLPPTPTPPICSSEMRRSLGVTRRSYAGRITRKS